MNTIIKYAVASLLVAGASSAFAQKAGDFILGVGGALIVPNTSLGTLTSTSSSAPSAAAFNATLNGANASIGQESTFVVSGLYMWTDNVATELTLGVPPKLTVDLDTPNGTAKTHPAAATARVYNPALVAKYLFNSPTDTLRPYLGLGVTYVSFTDATPNVADSTVKALAGSSASLSSSWAPVFNAGLIYNIDSRWSINDSISYVPLKTDVSFTGPGLGAGTVATTGTLTINPVDYVVRVGYKF